MPGTVYRTTCGCVRSEPEPSIGDRIPSCPGCDDPESLGCTTPVEHERLHREAWEDWDREWEGDAEVHFTAYPDHRHR